ncbi:MAG: ATP-binding cassette domain-containing protein [Pseudomonadota bacterium]
MNASCGAIQLRQVSARIGANTILHNINLQVRYGERIGILGHNGAGKSTLLRLLAGTLTASHGKILVLGQDLGLPQTRRERQTLHTQIGQIFRGLHLVGRLTALENALVGCLARNRSPTTWARLFPATETDRATALMHAVGLADRSHLRADRLSGGERQKVAIVRLLLQRPRLILADEPTSALDPVASVAMANMLSAMAKVEGAAMLTVVHKPDLLPLVADRVIGLDAGQLAFDLSVSELTADKLRAFYEKAGTAVNDRA